MDYILVFNGNRKEGLGPRHNVKNETVNVIEHGIVKLLHYDSSDMCSCLFRFFCNLEVPNPNRMVYSRDEDFRFTFFIWSFHVGQVT